MRNQSDTVACTSLPSHVQAGGMQRRWHELMDTTNLEDVAHEPFFQVVTHGGGVPRPRPPVPHTHKQKLSGIGKKASNVRDLTKFHWPQPWPQAGCLKGVCVCLRRGAGGWLSPENMRLPSPQSECYHHAIALCWRQSEGLSDTIF
jgi:hypothetical protein